jgi:NHLM bacteriocin system ABC transporter ATP-binding protein
MAETRGNWSVETGSVELWRTTAAGAAPHFLFSCGPGDVILGAADLLLRPGPEARLAPLDPAAVMALAGAHDPRLWAWLGRLAELLGEEFPPALPEPLEPGKPRELTAGQVIEAPTHAPGWLVFTAGRLRFLNLVELAPNSPPLPLPPGIWLTTDTVATCALSREPPTRVGVAIHEALEHGLRLFVQLVLKVLEMHDHRQGERRLAQLRRRDEEDQRQTSEALGELAGVLGVPPPLPPDRDELLAALAPIGRVIGVAFRAPFNALGPREGDPVAAVAEASRVRYRRIRLRDKWWQRDAGPLLGFLAPTPSTRIPVALVPARRGYKLKDPAQEEAVPVTAAVAAQLAPEALVFYRPLPEGAPGLLALARWAITPYLREVGWILALMVGVTLLGMLTPVAVRWIVDEVLPDASRTPLVQICLVLMAVGVGQGLLLLGEGFLSVRVHTGATVQLQAGVWDRLLRLGPSFFRQYAAGDLHQRAMLITAISHHINGTVLRTLLGGLMSFLNLILLIYFAPFLALIGVALALLEAFISVVLSVGIRRRALQMLVLEGRLLGFVVGLIQGISRLRVAAAEQRGFNQWAQRFARQMRLLGKIRLLEDINKLFTTFLPPISMLILLMLVGNMIPKGQAGQGGAAASVAAGFSPGQFVAFLTAYGMFVAGLTAVSQTYVDIVDVLSRERLMRPLLQETPEHSANRVDPGPLHGHLAVDQVSFRYNPGGPLVLNNVSLTARPGEFVAIVGPSGSGKSTLFRLLLGFERPQNGQVLYDGRNLDSLDLTAVRRQLGVVLQSSWILAGTIHENIAADLPLSAEEVWEAARAAALADDIDQMPMKLHTNVSAGGVNLSGGQRQRLLLARALVHHPHLLLLDEATSSLDNPTQARVSESLRRRQITRIMIAHRLSTIIHADRIYVLDHGRIIQTGTCAELSSQPGLFRTLIERQQAESRGSRLQDRGATIEGRS